MGLTIFEWLFSVSLILSPVIITPLWYFSFKSIQWYFVSAFIAGLVTYYVYLNPVNIPGVPKSLHWYGIFFIVYLILFGKKFRWTDWNKVVVISVYCLFIAGELWELPVYIYDYLGKINVLQNKWTGSIIDSAWIFSHMRRAYTLVSCYAISQIAKIRFTRLSYVFLVAELVLTSLLLSPLGFGIRSGFLYFDEIARISSLFLTGIIIWEGLDAN